MDKFLGIELDGYGFTIDSYWAYISLSWRFIATALLVSVGYKIYKHRQKSVF